jgi:hypothetical protein
VFPDTTSPVLQKIQAYQEETQEPIPTHKKTACPEEKKRLREVRDRLLPHHISLVRQYLPRRVYENVWRSQYRQLRRRLVFLENAIAQIGEYDPFFLTMDDIHDADRIMTGLLSRMVFYRDRV